MRARVLMGSRGLNRNFAHLDANGSMILLSVSTGILPGDIITDETEPGDARVRLHCASQSRLSILCHRVCLVEDDNLVRRTRISPVVSESKGGAT